METTKIPKRRGFMRILYFYAFLAFGKRLISCSMERKTERQTRIICIRINLQIYTYTFIFLHIHTYTYIDIYIYIVYLFIYIYPFK